MIEKIATGLFASALLHTFLVGKIRTFSHRFPKDSFKEKLFHALSDVELVFAIWAILWLGVYCVVESFDSAFIFFKELDFTEPFFVFCIMLVAATRPVQWIAQAGIQKLTSLILSVFKNLNASLVFYVITLSIGPLLGSLITEPAAMTVTALILFHQYFSKPISDSFKYKTLALLLVNISIGGVLTHFAAPPVVMVSKVWSWNTEYMLTHFGWKAMIAIVLNVSVTLLLIRKEFQTLEMPNLKIKNSPPLLLLLSHLSLLALIVYFAHTPTILIAILIGFLALTRFTSNHQDSLKTKEATLVAVFLAGLVVLGKPQGWWLSPIIQSLEGSLLFVSSTLLTAITDNAALTYLGAQVQDLPESLRYFLVAGAVTGGGLTVIANAPNPAAFGILKDSFPDGEINPIKLFLAAAPITIIAALCFLFL